jgi:hypothetical protein
MKRTINGHGVLRSVLEEARLDEDCSLGELTVLSAAVDPYRLDTAAGHRDGAWLAQQFKGVVARGKKIHWRGLHYAIVAQGNIKKPNGETYRNDDDNRNSPPIIHRKARVNVASFVSIGLDVTVPDADDINPTPLAEGFKGRQAYSFAIFGEKASLEDVLLPIARARQTDLYLPTGEISDTLLHQMASDANEDGRPLVVFTLADCDPSGRQMSVSIGRKLQALRDLLFPDFSFELVPVALTVEQVSDLGLPSTPLKETEKRADRWRDAFGVEQTEIDALATLRPDTLRGIVEQAFEPYFDDTLDDRVEEARSDWEEEAQQAIDSQIDAESLAVLREEAAERLTELQSAIDDITERLRLSADRFTLPVIEVPEPEIEAEDDRHALVAFGDDWVEATRSLIERKSYGRP